MFIMKLLFLILIIASLFFRVLYIWDFSIIFLVISCVLPVFCLFSTLYLKYKLKISFSLSETLAEKGRPFNVILNVVNNTIFPVAKAEAIIEYQNLINGDINEIELNFPIQSLNTQKIEFQLTSKFCGKIRIKSAFVMIYDPLRIFKAKIARNIETEIIVMPVCQEVESYISDSYYIDEESTRFSQIKSGDDPSEIFDFHEYQEGDNPSRIHWKLSSKKDNFIVKELSMPINEKVIIFSDIRCYEKPEYILPVFDAVMESMLSLSVSLLENEHPHYIITYNYETSEFMNVYIDDITILYNLIINIINNADVKTEVNPFEKFFEENPELSCSSFTCISHEFDREIINYLEQCVISEIKNAVYISHNSEEKDDINFDGINVFTVKSGKISSSISEINL